ncbi:MAG: glutaredoxin [Candidatus Omnitrophica bacterium]|nr:glutaredoxin [Candidatus Omnitrophota bacterium]
MIHLTLYHKPGCPYCQKVITFMQQNGISDSAGTCRIILKNRDENPGIRQELIDSGGKPQVPCLVIDGKAIYESDDIIQWFKKDWKKGNYSGL